MMNNQKLHNILQDALSPEYTPSDSLNMAIMNKVKENNTMPRPKMNRIRTNIVAAAAAMALLTTTVIATIHFLKPSEVARQAGDNKLQQAFSEVEKTQKDTSIDKQVSGNYEVTFLGVVSGEQISDYAYSEEKFPGRTYAVVSIVHKDGAYIDQTDLFVSPLIQGLNPAHYNMRTMNGGSDQVEVDGITYRIIDCDSIEAFADKELYLAVSEGDQIFNPDAYNYDEATGKITRNDSYTKMNLLFKLPIDKSKANKEKAQKYLEDLESYWKSNSVDDDEVYPEDNIKINEVLETATLVKDSVKVVKENSDGYYIYTYFDKAEMDDEIAYRKKHNIKTEVREKHYTQEMTLRNDVLAEIFANDPSKDGYYLLSYAVSDSGEGTEKHLSFDVCHKDDKGVITFMIYEKTVK